MKKSDFTLGGLSVVLGGWILYMTTTMKAKAAFWPKIVAYGIILMGAIIVIQALLAFTKQRKKEKAAGQAKEATQAPKAGANIGRVVMIIALLAAYYFGFQYFSYVVSTIVLIAGTSVILGYRNWKVLLPTAVIISITLYLAFSNLFHIHFPGIFF